MISEQDLRERYGLLLPHLDERTRRLVVATDAADPAFGGVARVARASGLSKPAIYHGMEELAGLPPQDGRIRRPGGGRKRVEDQDPALLTALAALLDPATRGDPMSPLRWSSKSAGKLAEALIAQGHPVSEGAVRRLLREQGYSLQSTRKALEGANHPDRDAQFGHISATAQAFQADGQPVISVDAKKKELIGPYRNGGQEWQPAKQPERVRVYDFPDQADGKGLPYGVYDVGANEGWVSVGCDHDTAAFAVATIGQWWARMGQARYPAATRLLICADGGGSNGSRCRLWKRELQAWADQTGLTVQVCHFPPGTSKWNKIEHRLFGQISTNWRGKPLTSHEVMVQLIQGTTTRTGLHVEAALDRGEYPTGIKVPDADLAALNLARDDFHGEWNYSIKPHALTPS